MFAYIEQDSFLHRRNPVVKLLLIAGITIIVCLSYFPVLPFLTFLLFFLGTWLLGKIPMRDLLYRMLLFLLVSLLFMLSMLLLRGLNEEPDILFSVWIFRFSERDLVHSVSLGFRILALVTMSMSFVLTTRPGDLVLSLVLQCRISVVHGYAAIAAYRFLPELQAQVDAIHLAQEIRGIPWNSGMLSRFASPFRVLLPLLCTAARRGERVACAMESRGMGRTDLPRTYYKKLVVNRADRFFLLISAALYLLLVLLLVHLNLFRFSFAAIQ